MSASITLEISNIEALNAFKSRVARLTKIKEHDLLTEIGARGESQTRRRIETEKTAPDGTPWVKNTEGTSILRKSGRHLLDSIAFNVSGKTTEWGASWEFAHVHQNGAVILPKTKKALSFMIGGKRVSAKKVTIPARPFVGLSPANGNEIEGLVSDFLGSLLS
jgi:phage gpG-like protein